MDGQAEEIGQFATAAAAASVLDAEGTPVPFADHPSACANCGASLAGPFCSQCGQKAHVHRSVGHVVEEIVHGITHFDSRFWRTMPLLLLRPGKLTRDYVQGRRARYIAPVALFLLTIFAMFLTFGFAGSPEIPEGAIEIGAADSAAAVAGLDKEIADLEAKLASARADGTVAADIAMMEAARTALQVARARAQGGAGNGYKSPGGSLSDIIRSNAGSANLSIETGNRKWDKKISDSLRNPDLVFYKMKQKGYKLSFLLVPLSLPWLWLLFAWKRNVRLYDHVVFLLYSQSFMAILLMLATAIFGFNFNLGLRSGGADGGLVVGEALAPLFLLVPIVHIFAQLKEAYALGWFSAAWRTVMLALFAGVTVMLYFVLILSLGVLD